MEASLINLPAFFRLAWSASLLEKARAHALRRRASPTKPTGKGRPFSGGQARPVRVQAWKPTWQTRPKVARVHQFHILIILCLPSSPSAATRY